jgi:hypothetical protein
MPAPLAASGTTSTVPGGTPAPTTTTPTTPTTPTAPAVGWSDVYPYAYPEQWIDVTGLHGRFAYVQIVDPDHLLFDSNPARHVSETYIELPSGRVLGHRIGVSAP